MCTRWRLTGLHAGCMTGFGACSAQRASAYPAAGSDGGFASAGLSAGGGGDGPARAVTQYVRARGRLFLSHWFRTHDSHPHLCHGPRIQPDIPRHGRLSPESQSLNPSLPQVHPRSRALRGRAHCVVLRSLRSSPDR